MPHVTKDSHEDELEAPRVDEYELDDHHAQLRADERDDSDDDDDVGEEGIVEDIDLDDLVAMEGPDA